MSQLRIVLALVAAGLIAASDMSPVFAQASETGRRTAGRRRWRNRRGRSGLAARIVPRVDPNDASGRSVASDRNAPIGRSVRNVRSARSAQSARASGALDEKLEGQP